MPDVLKTVLTDGVLALELHRPDKRNALNQELIEALYAALERADLDANVRVVMIRGAGPDFCAGADLAELLASAEQNAEANAQSALRLGEVFTRIRGLPKPVVAIVHGRALAGGCGLATACDLVLADPEAQFGYPEISRGFVPAMVMAMLRRLTGEKRAFDLVATGRVLSATEAEAAGLVSRVCDAAAAGAVVLELAAASPTALALIKGQFYQLDAMSFDDGIRLGAQVNAVARSTPDFAQAVKRFLKR